MFWIGWQCLLLSRVGRMLVRVTWRRMVGRIMLWRRVGKILIRKSLWRRIYRMVLWMSRRLLKML